MKKRSMSLALCIFLASGVLWAAGSPFAGKWKLNPAKSQMPDVMKVKALGGNKYDFNLGGDTVETIAVDGTDQQGSYGTTLAVTPDGPNHWRVVRKKNGQTTIVGIWTLSADGNTLTDNFTSYQPDGSTFHLDYVYKRTAGGPGFDGTWESTTKDLNSAFEMEISPCGENGLLLDFTTFGVKKELRFDGKAYPATGANVPDGYVSSARQLDERTIEVEDRIKEKHIDMQRMEVSGDGRTLTITVSIPNRDKPQIQVFDRE